MARTKLTQPQILTKARYQTDNSNTIANGAAGTEIVMQMGWGQLVGDASADMSDTITFPTPFTTVLGVIAAPAGIGGSDTVAGASITDFEVSPGAGGWNAQPASVTTSGFTLHLTRDAFFGNNRYWAYSWIAWGII
jgi:hypothetical protein